MSELPHDLLEEILCRVPATSLKRLRSTSKEWNRLFNDKKFSRKHFDKATKQFPVFMLKKIFKVWLLRVNLHSEIPDVEVARELSLIDHSTSEKFDIDQVFHCDGLLLCTTIQDTKIKLTRIAIWNPCTGQTKWIQTRKSCSFHDFVLGYSQDNKTCDRSYKILSYKGRGLYYGNDQVSEFEIYDISSNSWRNLHVTPIPDYHISYPYYRISLKGKTYWFGFDWNADQFDLISFNYTTERFERLCLPYQCGRYDDLCLSVVKEEKISVLLQRQNTSRKEIWVTNKIDDERKEMSWSKLLEVELGLDHWTWCGMSFLVDEEKKIVVCCLQCYDESVVTVSIVGEDNNTITTQVKKMPSYQPLLVDYVPSLIQID